MANALREGRYPGDWLKWEEDNLYSREDCTVSAGQSLVSGEVVMGATTATITWDGVSNAAVTGIILFDAGAAGAVESVRIARDAIVNATVLVSGGSAPNTKLALALIGIVARTGLPLSGATIATETLPGPSAP